MAQDQTDKVRVAATPFELTFEDYKSIHANQLGGKVRGWKAHAICISAALINIALSVFFITRFEGSLFGIEALEWINGFLGVGLLFMAYVMRPIVLRRHYKATGYAGQMLNFEADSEAIYSSREGLKSEIKWANLVAWSETDERLFFWINKIQAVVLRKSVLAGAGEVQQLRDFATAAGVERK